jgi:CRISPR-associated protein Cas1
VGKLLSFVYDIADLYKVEVTVPVAFRVAHDGTSNIESRARRACREAFVSAQLLERIVPDMQRALGLLPEKSRLAVHRGKPSEGPIEEGLGGAPGALWNEDGTRTMGGRNFSESPLDVSPPSSDEGRSAGQSLAGPLLDPPTSWSDEDDDNGEDGAPV